MKVINKFRTGTAMKAMLLNQVEELSPKSTPLQLSEMEIPVPNENEVLIKVSCCGVCHTELDEIEGRTPPSSFPMVPGHQVIGTIEEIGPDVRDKKLGERVGVAWIFSACGDCEHCLNGNENLCAKFMATGRDAYGGYAEFMTAPAKYVHPIPEFFGDAEAAPLLCAGAVGYRAMRMSGLQNGEKLGLTGFGGSAHLVLQLVRFLYPDIEIYVFARKEEERRFALELGAVWAGDTADSAPHKLNAIIDTTPAWKPVVEAMRNLKKGGRLVINAIRKEEADKSYLQHISYQDHLWQEKEIKSVANVTARDIREFLDLAAKAKIKPHIKEYALEAANEALVELKFQKIKGSKVLRIL